MPKWPICSQVYTYCVLARGCKVRDEGTPVGRSIHGRGSLLCEVISPGNWKILDHSQQLPNPMRSTPFLNFFFFLRNFFLKQEELGDSPWQDPPRLQCQGTKSRLVRRDTLIFLDSKDSSFCFCCWGSVKHKDRKKWILELDKPDFKFHLCHWTVTSDKWFIHPKLHFLIKLQWSLKWENNAYLMRSLQELNETVFY